MLFTRRSIGFRPLFCSLALLLAACSNGSDPRDEAADDDQPDGGATPTMVGTEDPDTDDPTELDVETSDEDVIVRVGDLEPGEYTIAIVSVDGEDVFSSAELDVEEAPEEDDAIEATLALPPNLDTQADLVEWNVRIERNDPRALVLVKSLLYFVGPHEVQLEGPARVTQGKEVAYRVTARDPVTLTGLEARDVQLTVTREDGTEESYQGVTDELGIAVIDLSLQQAGGVSVVASASGETTEASVEQTVQSEAVSSKVLLTTDKPLYKPGQTIQLRALALQRGGNTPVAGGEALFEVEDGKGNKVFKRSFTTDDYGIASTPFRIGNVVNEGTYKVRVTVGESISEKTVEVTQYTLPKFRVNTQTDKPWYLPGDTISGVVDAHYFFGRAVAGGSINIEAATLDVGRNVYQQVMGQTNDEGLFEFSVMTPASLVGLPLEQGLALINLTITATDTAGQEVVTDTLVRVANSPLSVSVVPEGTNLVAGIENRLTVFVTDPLGTPVGNAQVTLTPGGGGEAITETTNAQGYVTALWTPADADAQLSVDVTDGDVSVTGQSFSFQSQAGTEHVLVRTDKSVYDVGETVTVEVLTSDEDGSIFIDWLNDGQAVDLRTLEPEDGIASFNVTLDETLLGDNRIEAYIVEDGGNLVRAGRTIFARNASSLNVEITTDQELYEPGAPAQISFNVSDEDGSPMAAALGVQIVDEAVFALIDARPGLLNTYFQLEDEFAQPSYQLAPPPGSLSGLIFDRPEDEAEQRAAQAKAEATFAALGNQALMGLRVNSWPTVVNEGNALLQPYYDTEKQRLAGAVNARLDDAVNATVAEGCEITNYWCDAQGQSFGSVLSLELGKDFEAFDFWGNRYENLPGNEVALLNLSTRGPDEQEGTADDQTLVIAPSDLDWSQSTAVMSAPTPVPAVDEQGAFGAGGGAGAVAPPGALGGGQMAGDPAADLDDAAPNPENPSTNGGDSDDGPRVRSDFPETLYFNPAVITDASGSASIELNVADSITAWRISSMANSASGQLGSATGSMTVFQDFFVDVDFPATLTRGDEIDFPIAVYNYLDTPQTVNLELEADDWYTPLGETALSVDLEPGQVTGVSFPVRVETVGLKTLTVQGLGSAKSDAVARSVRVVPDGKQIASANSGSVETTVSHTVSFDAGAVPGSEQLYVNIFPTFLSQAVQGLDSMLQVPNGCFEQTTSTAWPNVLVTDYMQETDQITPEVLIKAESLMSAGYQRLLTFEHPGGGFSWFGTQDPAPFLSVTAFGLIEFNDMKEVHEVDDAMLQRTLAYLLSQQQPDGSWTGDMSEFFSFHTSSLRNTAFTLMAVGSSGYEGPETQLALDYIKSQLAMETLDDYTMALVANAIASTAPTDPLLAELLDQLADSISLDAEDDSLGSWDSGDTQTNFYGYGNDAAVTTTAMVVHAMLLAGGYPDLVNKGLDFITANKDTLGNFGSTQATVWALKTLLLAATKGTEAAVGTLVVEVDGEVFQTIELTEDQADVMTTVDLSSFAVPGEHTVTLTFSGEGKASYSLVDSVHIPWESAPAEAEGPLSVGITYDRTQLAVDETVTASVDVTNNTENTQNMALVTLGLPPGFEVQTDDFAEYLAEGSLSRFEITGKQLILYVTELAPSFTQRFDYRLKATLPVKASDGGGSVHLYYQPEQRSTAAEQVIEVL